MDAVAKTAYYCCGVRAADAKAPKPICGDHLAQLFMTEEGREVFRGFEDLRLPNASNATRTRIIDDWLRDRLLAEPDLRVILLGAGFDARAFRLNGGQWVELDQPAVIEEKDRILPASHAPNPITRIAIDFARQKLGDSLAPFEGEQPVVVMEGVSMYLTQAQFKSTLSALRRLFPRHTLICDLMTRGFSERYGVEVGKRIAALGGGFAELAEDPARTVTAAGYSQLSRVSMMSRARELGAVRVPMFLLNTLLRPLRDGYCVYAFEAEG